ncbi:nucleoid-associated protein [Vibrio barjaei]|uniref:nucleoid-associated protein n=1 Tax=Vibrio barjaei TaxID=1676683 RepID=UPI002283FA76|nr:nucleoid-associated protein [Vibrio barjaei]MCY9873832.1 nucleoid-associated protein [Vibrio barjaei]
MTNLKDIRVYGISLDDNLDVAMDSWSEFDSKNALSHELISEISSLHMNRVTKSYGKFQDDTENAVRTDKYVHRVITFDQMASEIALSYFELCKTYAYTANGLLVISVVEKIDSEHIVVAFVPQSMSLKVDAPNRLSITEILDFRSIEHCVDVNLTDLMGGLSNRYLSVLKGKSKATQEFIRQFVEHEVTLDIKEQSQLLNQAVKDYCQEHIPGKMEQDVLKRQVHNYCNDMAKSGSELELKELSREVETSSDFNLNDFVVSQGYELRDSFPVSANETKKMVRYSGSGAGLTINFDSELLGERVVYDKEKDVLVISGIPPNLKHQLL